MDVLTSQEPLSAALGGAEDSPVNDSVCSDSPLHGQDVCNSPSSIVPSLSAAHSPSIFGHDIALCDRPYLAHFIVHVSGILPKPVGGVLQELMGSSAARHAILALSSSNLAHLRGKRPFVKTNHDSIRSGFHVSQAIDAIHQGDLATEVLIATITFLAYYKLEAGSMHGAYTHTSILKTLALTHQEELLSSTYGRTLIRAGIPLRTLVKMSYVFDPISEESDQERGLQAIYSRVSEYQECIQAILSKATHLNFRLLTTSCLRLGYEDMAASVGNAAKWYTIVRNGVHLRRLYLPALFSMQKALWHSYRNLKPA